MFEDFQHVALDYEDANRIQFSHLHQYVSAYETSPEMVEQLRQDLVDALKRAKETRARQIVDQDGEFFFTANPNGTFDLCIPWKRYKTLEKTDMEKLMDSWSKSPDIHGPYCGYNVEQGRDESNTPILVYCGLLKDHQGTCQFTRSVDTTSDVKS